MANKRDMASVLAKRTLLTQKEAAQVIEQLFDMIVDKVNEDGELTIVGFGKFYLYEHKPRPVRNPKTQEEMTLASYKSLRFKSSNVLKKLLKNKSYNEDL